MKDNPALPEEQRAQAEATYWEVVEDIHERAAFNYKLLEITVFINLVGGLFIYSLYCRKVFMKLRFKYVNDILGHILNWASFISVIVFYCKMKIDWEVKNCEGV